MGKFIAIVLIEGFLYVAGWLVGWWAGIRDYPIARRTSPSRETAIFKPDQLSTRHLWTPEKPTRPERNVNPPQRFRRHR